MTPAHKGGSKIARSHFKRAPSKPNKSCARERREEEADLGRVKEAFPKTHDSQIGQEKCLAFAGSEGEQRVGSKTVTNFGPHSSVPLFSFLLFFFRKQPSSLFSSAKTSLPQFWGCENGNEISLHRFFLLTVRKERSSALEQQEEEEARGNRSIVITCNSTSPCRKK